MKILKHIITFAGVLFVFLILPAIRYVNFGALTGSGFDAVSAATTIITDKPSGRYMIFLNTGLDELETWKEFFFDKDIPVLMEDISCLVVAGDKNGMELARTYQSRLPENQMKITPTEGLLAVSKAENSLVDVMIMSAEYADMYGTDALCNNDNTEIILKQE